MSPTTSGGRASLTQILAKNPAFATFYELPGRRLAKIRGGSKVVRQSNEALAYLESLFPGSIGEACFIDSGGAENARAVKGRIETIDKLSLDETKASFFAPTFALRPGQVYQSRPYVSPDTNEWVVANSAPVELPGRATPAIVHFEVTLESLRRSAVSLNSSYDIQIVDAATGRPIIDTRAPFVVGVRQADRLKTRALPASALQRRAGLLTLDGHRVAYERLRPRAENVNEWIVVARAKTPLGGWLATISIWQFAIFCLAARTDPACVLHLASLPGRTAACRADRRPHRARQQTTALSAARARRRTRQTRPAVAARDIRPRRFQAVQRQLRPPGR